MSVGEVKGMMYVPKGCIKLIGSEVNRSDYPRLVRFVTENNLWTSSPAVHPGLFGIGNGTTTMVLPDWRGVVRRFLDEGKDYDIGRVLGTFQGDAIRNIYGTFSLVNLAGYNPFSTFTAIAAGVSGSFNTAPKSSQFSTIAPSGIVTASYPYIIELNASTYVTTAPENRMKNITEMAVMRY